RVEADEGHHDERCTSHQDRLQETEVELLAELADLEETNRDRHRENEKRCDQHPKVVDGLDHVLSFRYSELPLEVYENSMPGGKGSIMSPTRRSAQDAGFTSSLSFGTGARAGVPRRLRGSRRNVACRDVWQKLAGCRRSLTSRRRAEDDDAPRARCASVVRPVALFASAREGSVS